MSQQATIDVLVRRWEEGRYRSEEPSVAELCRDARQLIVQRYGVTLSPAGPPSREEGARLYVEQGCANCHGSDGSAQTSTDRSAGAGSP